MAEVGEAVCVDGLATRVQRPRGWTNQKVLYDAKRHTHTALGLSVRRLAGSCHEHELVGLARLEGFRDVFRAVAALVPGPLALPDPPERAPMRDGGSCRLSRAP